MRDEEEEEGWWREELELALKEMGVGVAGRPPPCIPCRPREPGGKKLGGRTAEVGVEWLMLLRGICWFDEEEDERPFEGITIAPPPIPPPDVPPPPPTPRFCCCCCPNEVLLPVGSCADDPGMPGTPSFCLFDAAIIFAIVASRLG